jgi:hypothetical protein
MPFRTVLQSNEYSIKVENATSYKVFAAHLSHMATGYVANI